MDRSAMDHVERKIQACIDGELAAAEAEAVRTHCVACERCRRAWDEIETVVRALDEGRPAVAPSASLWPLVAARLKGNDARLRLRPAFALGAGLAVVAGLAIGLRLGQSPSPSASGNGSGIALLAVGSLLDDDAATTLDEVYLTASLEDQ